MNATRLADDVKPQSTPEPATSAPYCRRERLAILVILAGHALLLAYCGWNRSPAWDEVGHLPAGVAHWQSGIFDLYRVNPPLVRTAVTALPYALGARLDFDGTTITCPPWRRYEFPDGAAWIRADGLGFLNHLRIARLCTIPISLFAGWLCYGAARSLYGIPSAFTALLLWCTSPMVIGHGSLITPDVAAAATAALGVWALANWCQQPSRKNTTLAGIALGLAWLTKFTNLMLGAMLLGFLAYRLCRHGAEQLQRRWWCLQAMGIVCLAVYLINFGYGFERVGRQLGESQFISTMFGGPTAERKEPYGNRFAGTVLGRIPVPLPENYLLGMDVQNGEFEHKKMSYLHGEWRHGGWWYYYLYAFLIKEPLGTLALLALAVGRLPLLRSTIRLRSLCCLVVPAVLFMGLVSSQTGFNHHYRYVLPAYPFLYVLASSVAAPPHGGTSRRWTIVAVVLVLSAAAESLAIYPHSLSFFNRAIGGPVNGPRHLLNSNIDWGQDVLGLAEWARTHPEARPLQFDFWGGFKPKDFPLWDSAVLHRGWTDQDAVEFAARGLRDRWIALSVNRIYEQPSKADRYHYFRTHPPDAMVGYSIYLYDLKRVP